MLVSFAALRLSFSVALPFVNPFHRVARAIQLNKDSGGGVLVVNMSLRKVCERPGCESLRPAPWLTEKPLLTAPARTPDIAVVFVASRY